MLPPSDSFQHQEFKLAEALSTIQAIDVPPPPRYTFMPVTNDSFDTYTIDDDEDDDGCLPPPVPITLHIDASLCINGQSNTIIMPLTNYANSSVSAQPPNPTGLATTAQASHARGERLTSAVLTALRDAGVLVGSASAGEAGRAHRPLELHVNASVHIHGEKNTICSGISRAAREDGIAVVQSPGKVSRGAEMVAEENQNRKRRAESEPIGAPKAKKFDA